MGKLDEQFRRFLLELMCATNSASTVFAPQLTTREWHSRLGGDAIADAIRQILSNPQAAARMAENGRQAVLHKYNWGIEEEKLLALYRSLEEK